MFIPREEILLENIILFFTEKFKGRLTKTFLMKLLYEVDSRHIAETGVPVTGLKYKALPHGPVPSDVLEGLEEGGDGSGIKFFVHSRFALRATTKGSMAVVSTQKRAKYDSKEFSKCQSEILGTVWEIYRHSNASEASQASHQYGKPWFVISDNGKKFGKEIPYKLILEKSEPTEHFSKDELFEKLKEYEYDCQYTGQAE